MPPDNLEVMTMADRITRKQLQYLVDEINRVTGSPSESWTKDSDGHYHANIGNYHLSGAYGGWNLERMHNDRGGVTTPLHCGHIPARDLYNRMRAFLTGLEECRK